MKQSRPIKTTAARYLCQQLTTPNAIQSIICIVGGLCCLTPLAIKPLRQYEESSARISLTSSSYRDSAVAAIALTLPIFLEVINETFTNVRSAFNQSKAEVNVKQALINTVERFILACAVLATSAIALMSTDSENYINMYLCASKCRMTFVGGAVAISLCRYDSTYWPVKSTYVLLILLTSSTIVGSFANNMIGAADLVNYVATALFMTAFAIFSYCNVLWLCSFFPILFKEATSGVYWDSTLRSSSICLSYQHLYVIIVTFVSLAILISRKIYPEIESLNSSAVFHHNLAFNAYLLFLLYISERMMKYEVVQGLRTLIQSKKTYVRYISHELRTPLNAAFLGLRLVCGNLQSSRNGEDKENFEILENVRTSCEAAVEILNDLLCFDKLESGILDLHKLETPVIPFISDCVHMFSSQAREAGIDISLVTSHANATLIPRNNLHGAKQSAASSAVMLGGDIAAGHVRDDEQLYGAILDSDIIMVDKFKMNQVLRNLISNALKFTPPGGSVTVSASFIPDDRLHADPVAHRRHSFADRKNASNGQSICIQFLSKFCFLSPQHRRGKSPATVHPVNREVEIERGRERGRESERDIEIDEDVEAAVNSISVHGGGNYTTSSRESNRFLRAPVGSQESNAVNGVEEEDTAWRRTQSKITQKSKSSLVSPASQDFTSGKLRITVEDTGCGISDENQVRLFKEIVQFTPEVLQAGGGSGLGLYISSNIIQMHSGTIEVQSKGADKGSTFVIEIEMHRQKPLCRSI